MLCFSLSSPLPQWCFSGAVAEEKQTTSSFSPSFPLFALQLTESKRHPSCSCAFLPHIPSHFWALLRLPLHVYSLSCTTPLSFLLSSSLCWLLSPMFDSSTSPRPSVRSIPGLWPRTILELDSPRGPAWSEVLESRTGVLEHPRKRRDARKPEFLSEAFQQRLNKWWLSWFHGSRVTGDRKSVV